MRGDLVIRYIRDSSCAVIICVHEVFARYGGHDMDVGTRDCNPPEFQPFDFEEINEIYY